MLIIIINVPFRCFPNFWLSHASPPPEFQGKSDASSRSIVRKCHAPHYRRSRFTLRFGAIINFARWFLLARRDFKRIDRLHAALKKGIFVSFGRNVCAAVHRRYLGTNRKKKEEGRKRKILAQQRRFYREDFTREKKRTICPCHGEFTGNSGLEIADRFTLIFMGLQCKTRVFNRPRFIYILFTCRQAYVPSHAQSRNVCYIFNERVLGKKSAGFDEISIVSLLVGTNKQCNIAISSEGKSSWRILEQFLFLFHISCEEFIYIY